MWLAEFLKLYPEAYRRVTNKTANYEKLEKKVRSLSSAGFPQITPQQIITIEDEANLYWTYPKWWPCASKHISGIVELPSDLKSLESKKRAITALYASIQHIEVVSVILRFTYPEGFGIISPPVVSLLNLVPTENETHPDHYVRYLRVLRDLSKKYSKEHPDFSILANVDMALWAAAHLSHHFQFDSLAEEMNRDAFFQEVRLKNLVKGFGSHWTKTEAHRLIFARTVLEYDFILSALIASRAFESIVAEIVSRAGTKSQYSSNRRIRLQYLIGKICVKPGLLQKLGISEENLNTWRKYRNRAVHPETADQPLTQKNARDLVRGVQKLFDNSLKNL
jgi:NOL1/NOP2/fmu family ribosome biogenesis protein